MPWCLQSLASPRTHSDLIRVSVSGWHSISWSLLPSSERDSPNPIWAYPRKCSKVFIPAYWHGGPTRHFFSFCLSPQFCLNVKRALDKESTPDQGWRQASSHFWASYVLHQENGSHITSPAYITGHFRIEQSKYRQENSLETFKWCEGLLWSLFTSDFAASVEPSSSSCLCNAKTTSQIPSKSHSVEWGKMQAPLSHAIKKKIKPLENHWCFWKCAVDCSRYYFLVCLGLYLLWTKKKKTWKKSSPSVVSQGWVQLQDVRLREIKGDKNSCVGESMCHSDPLIHDRSWANGLSSVGNITFSSWEGTLEGIQIG